MLFNSKIEEKLAEYPDNIREIAHIAIAEAKKLNADKLAQRLQSKVKQLARKEARI